ncbi:hypothetical protein EVAR_23162_1 [Eumeta japonica]|uniref:Uncharacterized protein n=1 Tax=Eumeta variegata TaxID=151549 RepID=A0A4C1VBC3_EUMVA|nr:hypothetical protein EVAR_23162_1 [Eumeta japonica]
MYGMLMIRSFKSRVTGRTAPSQPSRCVAYTHAWSRGLAGTVAPYQNQPSTAPHGRRGRLAVYRLCINMCGDNKLNIYRSLEKCPFNGPGEVGAANECCRRCGDDVRYRRVHVVFEVRSKRTDLI